MSNSTPNKRKRYQDMSLDELREATKEYDREHIAGKPLTPAMKARNDRAMKALREQRRTGGRPQVGQGAASVMISLERGLLEKADTFAVRRHMSRSEMVARALVFLIGAEHGLRPNEILQLPIAELLARVPAVAKSGKPAAKGTRRKAS
jgi:hypothetical protein